MSHAPYHSAKILFYFGLPTFFGALFHRSRARKERGEFSLFHSHSTGALSTLGRRRKNKPTIRKNTTTFRSFFSTFRQRFATFLHFRRRKVKIASLQRRPHARVTRTQRFFDFCLHPSPHPLKPFMHNTLSVKASPFSSFTSDGAFSLATARNR